MSLSRRKCINERYQAITLSLSLHAALLCLLFISFHQPGLPNGTTSAVVPITIVSADSLPESLNFLPLPEPRAATETAQPVLAESPAQESGEAALMLQTVSGVDAMMAEMNLTIPQAVPEPQEPTAHKDISELTEIFTNEFISRQSGADSVIVTNTKKRNTVGDSFIIAITISPMQASVEIIPANAAYSFQ